MGLQRGQDLSDLQCVGRRCGQDLSLGGESEVVMEIEMGGRQADVEKKGHRGGPTEHLKALGLKKKEKKKKNCFVNHNKKKLNKRRLTRGCWCSKYNNVAQNRHEYQYKRSHKVVWQD